MRQLKIVKQITKRDEESVNRYLLEVNKYSLIGSEEEVALTIRIRNGDQLALEKLVLANLRFVISVAKQYQFKGLSLPDLINEGNVGLVKAAGKFDETRGFKFISYAVWWIRQAITEAISEQTRIVRLPLNRLSTINKINRATPFLEQELEREPTDDELAEYLDLKEEDIKIANKVNKGKVSFDKPLSQDGNSDFNLYELVQTGNIPSPDENLMNESIQTDLTRALSKLSDREAHIITLSFGLNNVPAISLYDIGQLYEMSTERVRQIKSNGILKLKKLLQGKLYF